MIGELILHCFHARTNAHVLHLTTRSFAAHAALNEFYEAIVGLADRLAEAYTGDYGIIDFTTKTPYRHVTSALELLDDLRECVDKCAKDFDADDTYLHNLCDEIRTQICQTAYKLRFLK
jgi:hypothetical protein